MSLTPIDRMVMRMEVKAYLCPKCNRAHRIGSKIFVRHYAVAAEKYRLAPLAIK